MYASLRMHTFFFFMCIIFRKVQLLEDADGIIHLKNLSLHPAANEEEG